MREKLDLELFNNSDTQTKEDIVKSLGIYELRGLARALGIKSPTTKVREILIEDILQTISTGKPTDPQVSRKGRPFKKLAHLDSIVSMIANKPEEKEQNFETTIAFNQEIPVFTSKCLDLVKVCGVLRVGKVSTYFIDLRSNFHVFLSEEIVKEKGLTTGDFVECEAYKINDNSQYFVKNILKINMSDFANYKSKPDLEQKQVLPSTFLNGENLKILKGGRNILINKEPLFLNAKLKTLLSFLEKDEAVNVFLGLNLCFEDSYFAFSMSKMHSFVTEYLQGEEVSYDRIIDVINFVTRLSSQGFNVNLIIYDIGLLLSTLKGRFKECDEKLSSQEASKIFKKIISLAEAREEGTTTTLVATIKDVDTTNATIKDDLIRISAKID